MVLHLIALITSISIIVVIIGLFRKTGKYEGFAILYAEMDTPTDIVSEVCPIGSYCPSSSQDWKINKCPAGTYGSSPGLATASCSGRCQGGCVCEEGSKSACPSACPAGFYCPPGTGGLNRPPKICPIGKYCPAGSTAPIDCPAGTYGIREGLSTAACSGRCSAGSYCPTKSTVATQAPCKNGCVCPTGSGTECPESCPAGYYCPKGTGPAGTSAPNTPTLCLAGTYCPTGSTSATKCAGGWYGDRDGQTTAGCTWQCSGGWYCPGGNTSATQYLCPAGNYCPQASASPIPCPTGRGPWQYSRNVCIATARDNKNNEFCSQYRTDHYYEYYRYCNAGTVMYETYVGLG